LPIRRFQENFEKLRRGRVVMLSVTEEFPQILLQKPVEIADPIEPFGVNDHAEPRIGQKRAAGGSRRRIVAVDRDDSLKIAGGLSLQAIESLCDEMAAFIDRQSYVMRGVDRLYLLDLVQPIDLIRSEQISAK
jgi:hypothetical protein